MKKRGPWFRKAPPLSIEFLEDRVTPAAVFDLWAGTLILAGSDNADWIRVSLQVTNLSVRVNDDARSFAVVEVLRLHIDARGGNDTVLIADNVTLDAWISAGPGDDFIHSGSGNDFVEGNTGQDLIEGGAGNDVIRGGFGDDTIFGGAGDDQIDGDDSSDQRLPELIGPLVAATTSSNEATNAAVNTVDDTIDPSSAAKDRAGNDQIFGETGNDTIRGGAGDDLIVGGAGNDQLLGEAGNDSIRGGAGNDLIDGGPGSNHADGGAGTDTIQSDAADRLYVIPTTDSYNAATARTTSDLLVSNIDHLLEVHEYESSANTTNQRQDSSVPSDVEAAQVSSAKPSSELPDATVQFGSGAVLRENEAGARPGSQEPGGTAAADATLSVRPQVYSDEAISQQIDIVLQAAVLTDATSDGPDGTPVTSPRRERRRPTFLYIKPMPLPDLVPDIQLPLP